MIGFRVLKNYKKMIQQIVEVVVLCFGCDYLSHLILSDFECDYFFYLYLD